MTDPTPIPSRQGTGLFDEDPAFQRLRALRESGYDGPVDQDGRPVTTGRAAEVLAALRERGAK